MEKKFKTCPSCRLEYDYSLTNRDICLKCISREHISLDEFMSVFSAIEPFFGYISKFIEKIPTPNFPTIGVGIRANSNLFYLKYNLQFWDSLIWDHKLGVMKHEIFHIVLNHLSYGNDESFRFKSNINFMILNIAQDLAINSLIKPEQLPDFVYYPGRLMVIPPETLEKINSFPEPHRTNELARIKRIQEFILSLPPEECTEWYLNKILSNPQIEKDLKGDNFGFGELDEHDFSFNNLPQEQQDQIRHKAKVILREAANRGSWGTVSQEIQQKLEKYYKTTLNWKSVLNSFTGMCKSMGHKRSIKKIDRRLPYIQSGVKIARRSNIAVFVDHSGSVSDESLAIFAAELEALSKMTDFTYIPFDTEVDEKNIIRWKKGAKITLTRTMCGGTDFSVPTRWANARKKEYDGILILTDGYCEKPIPSLIRRSFIICPGGKLAFDTTDLVIEMTK